MNSKPTVIDLFSGCGGMSWGLHQAGFNVLSALDNSEIALKTFKKNHPAVKVYCGDIREMNAEKIREDLGLKQGE
ncbi:MAG: DNA cytosine methyltransferase, partial [Chitinophagales bacterium]